MKRRAQRCGKEEGRWYGGAIMLHMQFHSLLHLCLLLACLLSHSQGETIVRERGGGG